MTVVVGGGDTAMDCVRTAVRQGASSVSCLYRRDKVNMPGSMREVKNAQEEGVEFVWLSAPEAFLGDEHVTGVRVQRMRLGLPDATGRQTIQPSDVRLTVDADLVIKALGFDPEELPRMWEQPGEPVGHAEDGPSHGDDGHAGCVRGGRHRARRQPGGVGDPGWPGCRQSDAHVHAAGCDGRCGRVMDIA